MNRQRTLLDLLIRRESSERGWIRYMKHIHIRMYCIEHDRRADNFLPGTIFIVRGGGGASESVCMRAR
jgi:hypothetical protein